MKRISYRGKHFTLPTFSSEGLDIAPRASAPEPLALGDYEEQILTDMNGVWDLTKFKQTR
jgi:hypothetical protein